MNVPCKRLHLLDRDPDCNPDSELENFCSVYMGYKTVLAIGLAAPIQQESPDKLSTALSDWFGGI